MCLYFKRAHGLCIYTKTHTQEHKVKDRKLFAKYGEYAAASHDLATDLFVLIWPFWGKNP